MDFHSDIKEEFEPQKKVLEQERFMDLYDNRKEESTPQKEALKQFRKNLADVLTPNVTDKTLLKWLRTKNFHLRKCEELYRTMISTNGVFDIQEIRETWKVPEVIEKYEFASTIGIAKDGTPVRYIAMGRGDLKGYVLSMDVYDIGRYCSKTIEEGLKICEEQSIKLGREISETTFIIDMEYFSVGQVIFSGVTELGIDLFCILQDKYPEIWSNVLIINVPYYFHTIFNLFKPIFRLPALEKFHLAGRDQTPDLLLKYIDAEVLPAFLGGKRVDASGDPMCSEFLKFGGIIPEKYYLRNRTPLNETDPGVEVIWVQPRSCHNICVVAREANSILRVQVRSEGGSLPSLILYRKFGSDPENLDLPGVDEYLDPSNKKYNVIQCSPRIRLQSHICPIDNHCSAPWPGIYIFRIDNRYNWLSQRKCIYRIRVIPPDA